MLVVYVTNVAGISLFLMFDVDLRHAVMFIESSRILIYITGTF